MSKIEAAMRAVAEAKETLQHPSGCIHCRVIRTMSEIAQKYVDAGDFSANSLIGLLTEQSEAIRKIVEE